MAAPVPPLAIATIPVTFPAVVAVVADVAVVALPANAAVMVPAVKLPDMSRATTVEAVLADVALDVTVNVAAPTWFAVNVCDPDNPVPDTFSVNVPFPIVGGVIQDGAVVPLDCRYCPEVPAAENPVAPAPDWNGTAPATPAAKFVAVVAVVAVFADVAFPDSAAVIVPATKLPEASRATIADAVFRLVAFDVTVNVELPDWLAVNVADPDKPVPDTAMDSVPLLTLAAVVAVVALPLSAAVIVPAAKLPDASRATMAEAVLTEVAVVAALGMLVEAVMAPVPLPYT